MKSKLLIVTAVLSVALPAFGQSRITVPAFFHYKDCAGNVNPDWTTIETAGNRTKYVVLDLSALACATVADNKIGLNKLRSKGIKVLGYVTTSHGSRAQHNVINGGDSQTSVNDWYGPFSGFIDGIFF